LTCPQCSYDLAHAAYGPCPQCDLSDAAARAQSDDLSPWAWRHRQGTLLAFVRTVAIVFALNRCHLGRWGRLSLQEGRKSSRFAWIIGVWVFANTFLAYQLFGPPGTASTIGMLSTLLILVPVPAVILMCTVLGQAGLVSLVARRAGRVLQTNPRRGDDVETFSAPQAYDEDLACPECGYNLAGLPSDRCPECGLKGAVTFARRGHYVEVEHNVWPIVAYGTACWLPALIILDVLAAAQFGAFGTGAQALATSAMVARWTAGTGLAVSAVWWMVYHVAALERALAKRLSVWHCLVLIPALLLPTGFGAVAIAVFLGVIRGG